MCQFKMHLDRIRVNLILFYHDGYWYCVVFRKKNHNTNRLFNIFYGYIEEEKKMSQA